MPTVTLKFTFRNNFGAESTEEADYDLTLDPAGSAEELIEERCAEFNADAEPEDEFTEETEWEGEYEVVGYSDFTEDFDLTDFDNLAEAVEFAELLEKSNNPDAVELYAKENGVGYAGGADEAFCGIFHDEADFARSIADDLFDIPDNISAYIDYERMGSDLMHDYTGIESGGRLYVFNNF